jgi:glutamate formiminotransferase/glutamate formiminotransferase/formiminotetrahydrofolate cyclodeaminase
VPNVSEGRDRSVVDAIGAAYALGGARVLDTHVDGDHHRAVHTLLADRDDASLVDALVAGIDVARRSIDLRRHVGVHPRVGAADVVPLVPLVPTDMPRARTAAVALAQRVGEQLGLPAFLYGEVGEGRRPAFFRRGGPEELARRVGAGELAPDFGPARLDPSAGAVLVGARAPLAAFNLVLDTADVEVARAVAAAVRGSSGGMAGVQAIGLLLGSSGRAQVSMNVIDLDAAPLHRVVARVRREAAARGAAVAEGELVGLLLARVVTAAARAEGVEDVDADGLPGAAACAVAARSFALPELALDRIVEHHLRRPTERRGRR